MRQSRRDVEPLSGRSRRVAERSQEGDKVGRTAVRTRKPPRSNVASRGEFLDVLEDCIAVNSKTNTGTVHAQFATRNILKLGEQGCGARRLHSTTLLPPRKFVDGRAIGSIADFSAAASRLAPLASRSIAASPERFRGLL